MSDADDARKLVEEMGGTVDYVSPPLPDGSGFMTAALPLPSNHWLTDPGSNEPPMPLRVGVGKRLSVNKTREELAEAIRAAGRYACRASTMNGAEMDFDPDAMLQNLVVGLLGLWTDDGLDDES